MKCQTTLQVEEEPFGRLSAEIYVKLRCYCCGRILGTLYGYWATKQLCGNVHFATDMKVEHEAFYIILHTKWIVSEPNFRTLATAKGKI